MVQEEETIVHPGLHFEQITDLKINGIEPLAKADDIAVGGAYTKMWPEVAPEQVFLKENYVQATIRYSGDLSLRRNGRGNDIEFIAVDASKRDRVLVKFKSSVISADYTGVITLTLDPFGPVGPFVKTEPAAR